MPLSVLIAPDKFKGTLTAKQAANAIASGWKAARPKDRLTQLPISDGGDGFGPLMADVLGGEQSTFRTKNAAGEEIESKYWVTDARTLLFESASIIGLAILDPEKRRPFNNDSTGLGIALQLTLLDFSRHCIIGIGGSALGPALGVDALSRDLSYCDVHVVSNIDGVALEEAFARCDPAKTLIAVASKTFTTIETMTNAESALKWLGDNGVSDPGGRVIALTANPEGAVEWGVDETRILPFQESVGGRYSIWSSIGFPIAMAVGMDDFRAFLAGAKAVDTHFRDTDIADNLVMRAAFADLYYARVRGCQTRAVFAYDERLGLFPDYLQQLEMESNGKRVTVDMQPVDGPTAPITWGGVGTDAQHAVFQLLHQGTHLVPVDFIASIAPGDDLDPAHHRILLMNCFAQGAALMAGKKGDDPARNYPGDRPSATILCDDLDAATLGALIAFHEHRTFANAVLLGINPFDQFGVELGKQMAKAIEQGGERFDASTEALLQAAGLSQ